MWVSSYLQGFFLMGIMSSEEAGGGPFPLLWLYLLSWKVPSGDLGTSINWPCSTEWQFGERFFPYDNKRGPSTLWLGHGVWAPAQAPPTPKPFTVSGRRSPQAMCLSRLLQGWNTACHTPAPTVFLEHSLCDWQQWRCLLMRVLRWCFKLQ